MTLTEIRDRTIGILIGFTVSIGHSDAVPVVNRSCAEPAVHFDALGPVCDVSRRTRPAAGHGPDPAKAGCAPQTALQCFQT